MSSSKDILQSLSQKLKVALDEVNQIKESLLANPEMGKMREGLKDKAKVVGQEASRVFEELGRETYRVVKAGKITVPDAIRDTFEWAERNLSRFSSEPEGAAVAPEAENVQAGAEEAPQAAEEAPEAAELVDAEPVVSEEESAGDAPVAVADDVVSDETEK